MNENELYEKYKTDTMVCFDKYCKSINNIASYLINKYSSDYSNGNFNLNLLINAIAKVKNNYLKYIEDIDSGYLIVIIGKSGSGKDFIMKEINSLLYIDPLTRLSTRNYRFCEKFTGKDSSVIYNATEFPKDYISCSNFVRYDGKVFYFILNDYFTRLLSDTMQPTRIVISDPIQFNDLKNKFGDKLISIYIDANDGIRLKRMVLRANDDIYDIKEREIELNNVLFRIDSDKNDSNLFEQIKESSDLIINNDYDIDKYKIVNSIKEILNKKGER